MSKNVDIAALAREHAPAAIKALVDIMHTGKSASARLKAARSLKARMELVRQMLPQEAALIGTEIASTIQRESGKRWGTPGCVSLSGGNSGWQEQCMSEAVLGDTD
jgi:hypothetical protein